MSNRGAWLQGIGIGQPISFAEMNAAQANRQRLEMQREENKQREGDRAEARKAASATYLSNILDKKDFLSGSPYDPMIIQGIDSAMQKGMELAQKGADTPTITMALGPLVKKLNEYQSKAKLIESNIKSSADKLKVYPGYNTDGIIDESKKAAYFNPDGTMKDISQVDPQLDYTAMAIKNSPEKTTTSAWIDDLVNKTPLSEESKELQTMHKGLKKNLKYDIKRNYWESVSEDDNGNAKVDKNGNPVGIDVKSHVLTGKDGKPMIDPETNEPFRVMDDREFKGIMSRNPAAANNLDGLVKQHFMEAGAQSAPAIGSPEWEDMAKHILYQELKTRSKSSFKQKDVETKAPLLTRIELTGSANAPKSGSGSSSDVKIDDVYAEINKLSESNGKVEKGMGAPLNELSARAQGVVLNYARDLTKDDKLNQADIYIKKNKDGSIHIMDAEKNTSLGTIDFTDVNLKANKTVKPQQKILTEKDNAKYKIKGKTYSHKELMDMGYTAEQVSQYKQ